MKRNTCSNSLKAAAFVVALALSAGCSSKGGGNSLKDVVATVNGDTITVMEVREAVGIPGGIASAGAMADKEQKKKIVEQLAEARLVAQEARAQGLDKDPKFAAGIKEGESAIIVRTLFRKELDAKGKNTEAEVETAVKELMSKDKALKANDARARAIQSVVTAKLNKIQEELTAAARKSFPEKIDGAVIARIAKGESVPDDATLGQVGSEKITYGEAKALVARVAAANGQGGKDFSRDEKALGSVISQELSNRALVAYARQQGGDKGPWYVLDHSSLENAVLIGLLAEKKIFAGIKIGEAEIKAAYEEHKDMFNKGGKPVALAAVREQIESFLTDQKRKKAVADFVAPLKAKGKVSIDEAAFGKI